MEWTMEVNQATIAWLFGLYCAVVYCSIVYRHLVTPRPRVRQSSGEAVQQTN